jgi:ERCC4-type nuclease
MAKIKFEEFAREIIILIDSREKKIEHITKVFDSQKIKYQTEKLEVGDYSFTLKDKRFNCIIERKNSLDELSQNFTSGRERFKREFERLNVNNKCHLLIENNSLDDIICGNYRSEIHRNSFLASLLSFEYRYNINVHFISNNYTAFLITKLFYYFTLKTN